MRAAWNVQPLIRVRTCDASRNDEIKLYAFAANLSTLLGGAGLAATTFGT